MDVTVQCGQGKTKADPTPMALWDEQRADLDRRVITSGIGRCVDMKGGAERKPCEGIPMLRIAVETEHFNTADSEPWGREFWGLNRMPWKWC